MATLRQLRIEAGWTIKELKEASQTSMATISRIEAKERVQQKHVVQELVITQIVKVLSEKLKRPITIGDLEGVELAPPRPGRPKKEGKNAN